MDMTFERKDTPTIVDGAVVRYRSDNLEISASRNGVCVSGLGCFKNAEELLVFKKYLQLALSQHLALSWGREPLTMGIEEISE
jgi:hypothetical protein